VAGGLLVVVAASVAAWALASRQNPLSASLVRAVADCAAMVTLGLTAVPMLDIDRYRGELTRRATGPLVMAGAVWLLAELTRIMLEAAEAAALSVFRVGLLTATDFAVHTAAGRNALFSTAAALVVVVAAMAPRNASANLAVAGVAAVGVTARPLTGHLAESTIGGAAIAAHTLAAGLWCGTLAALVLTVDHRGQWARVLPRFSQLSVGCVVVVLAGGVAGAVVAVSSPEQLISTGYGRLLSAKVAVMGVLVVLAWRNRTMWVPAARSHRTAAVVSRSRALTELAIMAAALTLAAALAVSG
jgi:putative copper resistance protein D